MKEIKQRGGIFKVTDKSETRTVFTVMGLWRDCTEKQLKHMMIEENEDILRKYGNIFLVETKLVRRRDCKNREKENGCALKYIYEHMIARRPINIDLEVRYIEEETFVEKNTMDVNAKLKSWTV